jgi:hypothetical protein
VAETEVSSIPPGNESSTEEQVILPYNEPSDRESAFIRAARWFEPRIAKIGAAILGAGGIIWGPFVSSQPVWAWGLFGLTALGYGVFQIYEVVRAPAAEEIVKKRLETKVRQCAEMESRLADTEELLAQYTHNQETILAALLRSVVEHESLKRQLRWGETDRINLFYPRNNIFDCLARYSVHPEFKKRGKLLTSLQEGYLGQAYLSDAGSFFVNGLPCFDENGDEYERIFSEKCNLPIEDVKKIRMKPRSILVCSVYDVRKVDRMALCVFESLDPGKFEQEKLREKVMDLPVMTAIRDLIELAVRSDRKK